MLVLAFAVGGWLGIALFCWQALVATAVGVAVGKWLPGIVPLNAVLGAAFTYFILVRLTQRPVLVQEASKC